MKATKLTLALLLVLTMVLSAFALSSCTIGGGGTQTPGGDQNQGEEQNPGDTTEKPGTDEEIKDPVPLALSAPTVTLDGNTAVWEAVPNAVKFEISIDGMLYYMESTVTSKVLEDGQTFKVRAIGDNKTYTDSEWSEPVHYFVPIPTYTVSWCMPEGDVLEIDENVPHGTTPEYNGAEPAKENCAFTGWSPEISEVCEDVVYYAQFIPLHYTVEFKDYDGSVIKTYDNVMIGEGVEAPDVPRRNGYNFIGWDKEYDVITSDLTVTAQYEIVENQICVDYYHSGLGTVTAVFSINGDVDIAMIELQLGFELENAIYEDAVTFVDISDVNYVDGVFYFSLMSAADITESTELFSITFAVGDGEVDIAFTVLESYVSDGTFTEIKAADIVGTSYGN